MLVLEQHYTAGGFTHAFARGPYAWNVGVHYIGVRFSIGVMRYCMVTAVVLVWCPGGGIGRRGGELHALFCSTCCARRSLVVCRVLLSQAY
jgi:phytoene dehydrogenase-like protein